MLANREVHARAVMSSKTSSVVVTTRVMESHRSSAMTSLKTITHKRSSSGDRMIEEWSSPSLVLTSPQTWVSGPQAKFLSSPKSPFPNRRITRRSSVYVKPALSTKSKSKSSPKALEFKVPSSSMTSLLSSRSRQSAVFEKSDGESATSRRSSVYRKTIKKQGGNVQEEQEEVEIEISAPEGKKSKAESPKRKISKLPVAAGKKSKSPAKIIRARKRNVLDLVENESSEKPLAKRRKQASDESFIVSSAERKLPLSQRLSETSAGNTVSSSSIIIKEVSNKTVCKRAKKTPKSSMKKTRSVKSEQSSSSSSKKAAKAARSPSSPKKAAKSPASPKEEAKSPASPKKAQKSPASSKKTKKSPVSPRKAKKSPASPKNAAKSLLLRQTHSATSVESASAERVAETPASPGKDVKSLVNLRKALKSKTSQKKIAKSPVSPMKAAKSSHQKTHSAMSAELKGQEKAAESPLSLRKAVWSEKSPQKAARSPVVMRKAAKSPITSSEAAKSPVTSSEAAKSPVTPRKAVKSAVTPRKAAKSPVTSRKVAKSSVTLRKAAKSPLTLKKAAKSPVTSRKAAKSPVTSRKAAKSPVTPRKAVKSPVTSRKAAKSPVTSSEAAKSPMTLKKAAKSPVTPREAAKSPMTLKKAAKSPVTPSGAVKSPMTLKKAAKSPFTPSGAVKSPMTLKKAAKSPVTPREVVKSPVTPRKAESPSRKRTHSVQSAVTPRKAVKSPVTPRKAAKSPITPRKAVKSPVTPRKTVKSPVTSRKAAKSPVTPRKTAKSPVTPRKAESPSRKRTHSVQSANSSVRKGKSNLHRKKAKNVELESTDINETTVENEAVVTKSQKRKRTKETDIVEQSPKLKLARLSLTPHQTSIQKFALKTKSAGSHSTSTKLKSKKSLTGRTSSDEETVSSPTYSHHTALLQSSDLELDKKTPSNKLGKKMDSRRNKTSSGKEKLKGSKQKKMLTKRDHREADVQTPRTPSSRKLSEKLHVSSKTKSQKLEQFTGTNADFTVSSHQETQLSVKKTSDTPNLDIPDAPTSTKKGSTAKSGKGKKPSASKSSVRKIDKSFSTPESGMKRKQKVLKSSAKKSLSANLTALSGHKSVAGKLDISDGLDGSYLQVSKHQSEETSYESSVAKTRTSAVDNVARSEDKKIMEILKKTVHSTPESTNSLISMKSKTSTPRTAIGTNKTMKRLQNGNTFSTPKSLKMIKSSTAIKGTMLSQKSASSSVMVGSTPRIVVSESSPQSISLASGSRKTLGRAVNEITEDRLSRHDLLSPLTLRSGRSSLSRNRRDDILSHSQSSASSALITSRHLQDRSDADHLELEKIDKESGVLAQRSGNQDSISLASGSRKTLGRAVNEITEDRLSRHDLLSPLTLRSGRSSLSRNRRDDILSHSQSSASSALITSRHLQDRSDADYIAKESGVLTQKSGNQALKKFDRESGVLAQRSGQDQYIEHHASSTVERYRAHAVERTVGDQRYRAGSYQAERKQRLRREMQHEGHREEGDDSNSANVITVQAQVHNVDQVEEEDDLDYNVEDPNSTISTSTHSTRCIIL